MKTINKLVLPIAYSSIFISLVACAAESPPTPTNTTFCQADNKIYFSCSVGKKIYTLCDIGKGKLSFTEEEENKQTTLIFTGDTQNDFNFSNYHRFKTTQNSLVFTSGQKYELFEYLDEEIEPAEKELGIIIGSDDQVSNLYCDPGSKSKIAEIGNP